MPLSEHELRTLEQLEAQLSAEDPKFASAMQADPGAGSASPPPSSTTDSSRSADSAPDCASPRTSPSRRWTRSSWARTNPSVVAATASSRSMDRLPARELVTSRHRPGSPPRPTRPRSWWSWLTPKRSASITTMTVASGTSTPT